MLDEVTLLKQIIENLEEELYVYKHDQLTNLLMRRDFEKKYEEYCDAGGVFYLTFVDINGLHALNRDLENGGYDVGDELIKSVVHKLTSSTHNIVYKIGGDEFAIFSYRPIYFTEDKRFTYSTVSNEGCNTLASLIRKADTEVTKLKEIFYSKNSRRKSR